MPRDGELTNILCVMNGAITGTDAEITLYIDGVSQGQTISVPVSGSGDGVKVSLNLSPTYSLSSGEVLKLETNGASTGAVSLYFTCKFTAE